jgi:hypothetical protein
MTDTTKKGFLDSEASDILSADFDDRFQSWLAVAVGVSPYRVHPNFKSARVKSSDCCNEVYFQFEQFSRSGVNNRQSEDSANTECFGTVVCSIAIYGDSAREIALRLIDAGDLEQNTAELSNMGLGWIDGTLQAILTEQVGNQLRLRADVQLNFNYRYGREWAVRKITDAKPKLIFNQ